MKRSKESPEKQVMERLVGFIGALLGYEVGDAVAGSRRPYLAVTIFTIALAVIAIVLIWAFAD